MKFKLLLILAIFLLSISSANVSAKNICALHENLDETKCAREIYLQNNISDIAKHEGINPKEGKKFYVNSIDWITKDSVLLEFEDGDKIYLALIDFKNESNAIDYIQIFEPGIMDSLVLKESISTQRTQSFLKDVYAKIKDWFSRIKT